MKPIQTFAVVPKLPGPIEGLRRLAHNLRWSWSHQTIDLFRRLDEDLWESCGHNPVAMLGKIDQSRLEHAAGDDAFLAHLERVHAALDTYMAGTPGSRASTEKERSDWWPTSPPNSD
jgi:starch phosphorylase